MSLANQAHRQWSSSHAHSLALRPSAHSQQPVPMWRETRVWKDQPRTSVIENGRSLKIVSLLRFATILDGEGCASGRGRVLTAAGKANRLGGVDWRKL